jgi:glycopeptide antibiotics resistance protein
MFHKLITIAAWALLAFIAYATISPIHDRPTLLASSSFEHFAAFAVIGVLFLLAYPRQTAFVCLIVLGCALMLEILQLLTQDRHARIQDAMEKMGGGVLGIVAGRVILYFEQANRWLQIKTQHVQLQKASD